MIPVPRRFALFIGSLFIYNLKQLDFSSRREPRSCSGAGAVAGPGPPAVPAGELRLGEAVGHRGLLPRGVAAGFPPSPGASSAISLMRAASCLGQLIKEAMPVSRGTRLPVGSFSEQDAKGRGITLAAAAWLGALDIQLTPAELLEMEYQVLNPVINTNAGADATLAGESEVFRNGRLRRGRGPPRSPPPRNPRQPPRCHPPSPASGSTGDQWHGGDTSPSEGQSSLPVIRRNMRMFPLLDGIF